MATSRLALGCAVLLAGIAVWEIVATRRAAGSVPGDDAWERAAAIVRKDYRAGDLIVFAPRWVDPTGRMHLGDLISVDDAARMDDATYGRIWELSIRGAHAMTGSPAFDREVDGIEVRRYEQSPRTVLADVRTLLPKATLDHATATLELAEVGFEPHRCVQVVPAPNVPARVTFALPAGMLVGYVGLADVFTRRDIRAPATLAVELQGQRVEQQTIGVDDGWVRFALKIPADEDVTFVIESTAPQRLVCFAAQVRQ